MLKDTNPAGGSKSLLLVKTKTEDYSVAITTAQGRTTTHQLRRQPNDDLFLKNTFPDHTWTEATETATGAITSLLADKTVVRVDQAPDPRFGVAAMFPFKSTVILPSGLSRVDETNRTVVLGDPTNPLSLRSLTEKFKQNGVAAGSRTVDAITRQTTLTSALGRTVRVWQDARGRVTRRELVGLGPIDYAYDSDGRVQTVTQTVGAEQRIHRFNYDPQGRLVSLSDPLSQSAGWRYDNGDRITHRVFNDGREVAFTYDTNSNMTSITPPGRPSHEFNYTAVDQLSDYLPPEVGTSNRVTHYDYDLDGQLVRVTRPDGQIVELIYDSASGRLTRIASPSASIDLNYNTQTGQIAAITAADGGRLQYVWDGALLKDTIVTGVVNGTVSRTYDAKFRLTGLRVNNGANVAFTYDEDGLLVGAGDLTVTRDPLHGAITATLQGGVATSQSYNAFGEITRQSASFNGSPLLQTDFIRDALGRITTKTETEDGVSTIYDYTYDPAGRLSEVRKNGLLTSRYDYDANGNRSQHTDESGNIVTGTYDDQDRLLQYGDITYSYSANGELATKTENGQTTEYNYDVFGNLRRVVQAGGTTIEYIIDGSHRRIGKRVNGQLTQGLLYLDSLRPIAELDGSGNVVSYFIYGERPNVPEYLLSRKLDGTQWVAYRLLSDALGSPRVICNANTGEVIQRMVFDEYGRVLADTNPGFQPFGFAGGLFDPDTGMVRFGARDYDPTTGSWTARDPIGFRGGDANLYRYGKNNPGNAIDVDGRKPGDFFTTVDGVLDDAKRLYNNLPVEYCGFIYKMRDARGRDGFSYECRKDGANHCDDPQPWYWPVGAIGEWHTHAQSTNPADENPSDADVIRNAWFHEFVDEHFRAWLITPSGNKLEYTLGSEVIEG